VSWQDEWKLPRSARRLADRHSGQSGIIVYGWFVRYRYWDNRSGWQALVVHTDRQHRGVLTQLKRGPLWIDLPPGTHLVTVLAGKGKPRPAYEETIDFGSSTVVFIGVSPPTRVFGETEKPLWRRAVLSE
jgi:hypothetical protein